MKNKLIAANLADPTEDLHPDRSILDAWKILSRLGNPCRYGGKTQNGLIEYLVINPATGATLVCGQGETLPLAMCDAALAARNLSPPSH